MTATRPDDSAQLEALRATFPDFEITIVTIGGTRGFGAVRLCGNSALYSVCTSDAKQL